MTTRQPNILLIQADQLKPHVLGAYGGPADTPHLDRLAGEGVVFENTYCNFPLCAPSRFSMLSGMLPSRIGAYDNGAEFLAQIPTMAHYLRLAGYHTCLSGKQHFVGPDTLHGFHERLVPELYPNDFSWSPYWGEVRMESNNDSTGVTRAGICARTMQLDHDETVLFKAKAKLHDLARLDGQPFFLVASFTHPHEPYYCLQAYWDRYRTEDIPMPETPLQPAGQREAHTQRMLEHHGLLDGRITEERVRVARQAYLANVSYFDDVVGQLLATLSLVGLADDTVVLITSDHGDMLGEHGMWFKKHFFDHCARVPLIMHAPREFGAKRRSEPVSLVDLLPTLVELAGNDANELAPEPLDGASLLPLCQSADNDRDRPVYGEITSEGVPEPMFMVRHGDHKLIQGGAAPPVLFDLSTDPNECRNVWSDPGQAEARARLSELAESNWDAKQLQETIELSQRRRRIVNQSHDHGPPPNWYGEPVEDLPHWLLRRPGLYNDWAWRGIKE